MAVDLYNRIEDAALPPADSLDFLAAAAERIRTAHADDASPQTVTLHAEIVVDRTAHDMT